jgi:hypothetical protein
MIQLKLMPGEVFSFFRSTDQWKKVRAFQEKAK